jgi:ribosomal protein S27AE
MEATLTITGSFADILESLRLLSDNKAVKVIQGVEVKQQTPESRPESEKLTEGFNKCIRCGKKFVAKQKKTKYCGKKCYMIHWHELHPYKLKPEPSHVEIPPPTMPSEKAKNLNEKLESFKKQYPIQKRPEIIRNL